MKMNKDQSNNLSDLNAVLFNQIRNIENKELSDEELEREIKKSESITKVASVILANAKLALDAQKLFEEYGTGRTVDIPLLGISNEKTFGS
jgi:hypothetical protein